MIKINKQLYELTPSQEVERMQLKYSIDKRIINVMMSATCDYEIDINLMTKAMNLAIQRNDCTRIRFVKVKGKLMQYFDDYKPLDTIPYVKFNSLDEEKDFISKEAKKPIRYMKGVVFEPTFCKTSKNKFMIFIKVCHMIFDMYGLNIFFKDLFDIYNALKSNQELPLSTTQFEELVKKDLQTKNNLELDKKRETFFRDLYTKNPEPYYAGIHGLDDKLPQKVFETHSMKMFLLKNETKGFMKDIDEKLSNKIITYCKENRISPANFLFFTCSLCQSKMNRDVNTLLQLELCNCRATAMEKSCAGTKVQSLGCYINFNPDNSIEDNIKEFCINQNTYYRYLGYSDVKFQMLTHKIWKAPVFKTYYALTFSFIPMNKPENVHFQMYSNEKFPLPCYFAIMYDINTGTMQFLYDCQIKLINEEQVNKFHNNYLKIINETIDNPNKILKDITL